MSLQYYRKHPNQKKGVLYSCSVALSLIRNAIKFYHKLPHCHNNPPVFFPKHSHSTYYITLYCGEATATITLLQHVVVSRCSSVGIVKDWDEAAAHCRNHSSTAVGSKGTYNAIIYTYVCFIQKGKGTLNFPGSIPQGLGVEWNLILHEGGYDTCIYCINGTLYTYACNCY